MSFIHFCSKKLVRNISVLMAMFLTLNGFSDKVIYAHGANDTPSFLVVLQDEYNLIQSGQAKPMPAQTEEVVIAPVKEVEAETEVEAEAKTVAEPNTNTETETVTTEVYQPTNTPIPPPKPNKVIYSVKNDKKRVALTFDDGPDAYFTPMILDILKENNIKATFFVIGTNAENNPDVVQRIHDEGHVIGNHSYDHKDMTKLSADQLKEEIQKTEQILDNIVGSHDPVFRPPYGSVNQKNIDQLNEMGYSVVNWSVDTRDWAGTSQETMMSYVHKQMYPGGIILMHSSGRPSSIKNTVAMLPSLIAELREQGYEFVTVTELMGE